MSKSEDAAYQRGYDDFYDGIAESKNPFPVESVEHLSWNDGYNVAAEDEDKHL